MAEHVDVVIAGAGPTGLMLAGDLAARGVRCAVLERRADSSNLTRAFAVHARTLEQLDARGLAEDLLATGTTIDAFRFFGGAIGISLAELPSRFPYILVTPQYQVEEVLRRRAERLGARIVRGSRVVGLDQDAAGVTVRTENVSTDAAGAAGATGAADSTVSAETEYRASYVVGADGVHSAVRELIGVPYPGHAVVKSLMLADVRLADPPADVLTANGVASGFAFIAPFGDGFHRVFAWNRNHQVDDSEPVELDEVREVVRQAFGTDFGMGEARFLSRFHSDERQAPTYRVGRVLLAGDAAHCHSPAGGQGMNTGLQDAVNLGWKLAAVVQGAAAPDLLDSYQAERHPVGRLVLRSSGALVRLALVKPHLGRSLRDALAGTALRVPGIANKTAGVITGIGIDYGRPRGAHPLVGKRAADLPLTPSTVSAQPTGADPNTNTPNTGNTATRLYEALRANRFVLVSREPGTAYRPLAGSDETSALEYVVSPEAPAALILVRPDGYIAWASDSATASAVSSVPAVPVALAS
jgi:2-polyprenyl-6-methoxyphenol hydroxylase-like FAD-dependent oxidoreductase